VLRILGVLLLCVATFIGAAGPAAAAVANWSGLDARGYSGPIPEFMGTPRSGFDRPIFLGVGLLDRDVPPELTLTFFDQLVANGQDVVLKVYPDEDHSGTVLASLPDSTPFLQRAFAS
jgi:Prolyl oligopeptidase family